MKSFLTIIITLVGGGLAFGHATHEHETKAQAVMADLENLKALDIPVIQADKELGVGVAIIEGTQAQKLSELSHKKGACGGYQVLPIDDLSAANVERQNPFAMLRKMHKKNEKYQSVQARDVLESPRMVPQEEITAALEEVREENVQATVEWLSSYPNRYARSSTKNQHVNDMRDRLQALAAGSERTVEIDIIEHSNTQQNSVRARIVGSSRASEIVVLGGHLDSITQTRRGNMPGADDNASGSAALMEAYRILLTKPQLQRTVEFMWYAGEELGLLGSADIARKYKRENKDVIGVMQLDMTMNPGSGELTFASINDFTNAWLRDYIVALNRLYIGARIIDDRCGYACSDHASWHNQGFPAVMPFESATSRMNRRIHTRNDVIGDRSSMAHIAMFSRLGLAFAMDLADSSMRHP